MKAYLIKIILEDSEPLIWRKVTVPAEITFKRLHDIIQFSMGWMNYHLYEFYIEEEKLRIVCDEEPIEEYETYSKMNLNEENDPNDFIAEMLKVKPKLSTKVKIDKYLSNNKSITYMYDFGDCWIHNITLEEVIYDYDNSYPKCVEGEGACPPEDVGGITGYAEFLEIINDKSHPEYEESKKWAEEQEYNSSFYIEDVNKFMRYHLKLKKVSK